MNAEKIRTSMNIAFAAGIALKVTGAPGVGKTSIAAQYAAEQRIAHNGDFGEFELNCATATLADVVGYLMPENVEYRNADGKSVVVKHGKYTYPYWLMDKKTGKPAFLFTRGILILEEWGQATGDVKRALAQVIEEKRIGEFRLDNLNIFIASNRPEDRAGVSKEFDFLINRWQEIDFTPDLNTWVDWAVGNDINPTFIAFAAQHPDIVFAGKVPEKQGPWCTPRSLVKAASWTDAANKQGVTWDNDDTITNLTGIVGVGAARSILTFIKLGDSLPTWDEIVGDPEGTKIPEAPDARMVLCYSLAAKLTADTAPKIAPYVLRFPKQFMLLFVKAALKRDKTLLFTKLVGEFQRKNADVIQAVMV